MLTAIDIIAIVSNISLPQMEEDTDNKPLLMGPRDKDKYVIV